MSVLVKKAFHMHKGGNDIIDINAQDTLSSWYPNDDNTYWTNGDSILRLGAYTENTILALEISLGGPYIVHASIAEPRQPGSKCCYINLPTFF